MNVVMSISQVLYQGNSKSVHLFVLAAVVLFSHLGAWLFIQRTRARIEQSTKLIFQRSQLLLLSVASAVLSVSYLYPSISSSVGFQVTVSLLVVSVVIHSLTKLGQNGIERTSGYVAGAGAIFVVLVILPALFVSNVPKVVAYPVLGVSLLVISVACIGAYVTWRKFSSHTKDALAAFRAKRMIKVLLGSATLAVFLLACTPFMMYVTPIESIATFFCSSVVCVSGLHVATERVGFLVEYAQQQIPHLKTMPPLELEQVTRRAINSARALAPVAIPIDTDQGQVTSLSGSAHSIKGHESTQERELIGRIIAHREVENEIFRVLLGFAEPGEDYVTFRDFSEILLPHIQFGRKMVGDNIVGISVESMETIAQVISAAKSSTPVIFCGEVGVGKRHLSVLLAKIRGIKPENIHEIPSSKDDAVSQLVNIDRGDPHRKMVIIRIDSSHAPEGSVGFIRQALMRVKNLDMVFLVERRSEELSYLSVVSHDSVIVPETIEITPLRNRPQDSVCQSIWFLFNEAHSLFGETEVKRLRVRSSAVLEALAYKWPGNSGELQDAIKSALYFAHRSSSFDIESIVPFFRVGEAYEAAPWLRDGIGRYFSDFSSGEVSESQFLEQTGVTRRFARLALQSMHKSGVVTA